MLSTHTMWRVIERGTVIGCAGNITVPVSVEVVKELGSY